MRPVKNRQETQASMAFTTDPGNPPGPKGQKKSPYEHEKMTSVQRSKSLESAYSQYPVSCSNAFCLAVLLTNTKRKLPLRGKKKKNKRLCLEVS